MRTAALYVSGAIAALGVTLALRSEPPDLSRAGTSAPAAAQKEIESVEKEINRIEDETLTRVQHEPSTHRNKSFCSASCSFTTGSCRSGGTKRARSVTCPRRDSPDR
jgi:hypothetical protein